MEEKSKSSKWLLGCGIGCGIIILLGVITIFAGYFICKGTVEGFKEVETTSEKLKEKYCAVEDYIPSPDGIISDDRIEIFLAVRDSMRETLIELEQTLKKFEEIEKEDENKDQSFWSVMDDIKSGFNIVPQFAQFYLCKNKALLKLDMSPGEYYYIYVMAYYSYLGKSPGGNNSNMHIINSQAGFTIRADTEEQEKEKDNEIWKMEMKEDQKYAIIRHIRWIIIPVMENQLDKINENPSLYSKTWRRKLENEVKKLKDDRRRIPWKDNLPQQLEKSFAPYKNRLEQSYSSTGDMFELMRQQYMRD